MFRQHLVSCNCQLFSPQHYQNYESKEFRSPPAHNTRKATNQKRSLKRHSHSRNRIMQQSSKFIKNSQKNMKVQELLSCQSSNISGQSGYQFKARTENLAKISLLNSKKERREADQKIHKQNNTNTCLIRSIKYQTRVSSQQPNQNMEVLKEITSTSNIPQNNYFIRMPEPIQPLYSSKYPKYRKCSAQTTLTDSIVPYTTENVQKISTRLPHYFQNDPQAHIQNFNKNIISQQQDIVRPTKNSNFFKLSRLSEMISDKQETQSVYQGQKTHDQGGVQFSRVLISYKKLMQQQNGVLQQIQRTILFEYYPQPSIRSNQSSKFQKIHLLPSNLRS